MQLASSLRAYVNGDVATYWTSPDGEQVDVELRLPQTSRENIAQLDALPVAYAKDGTPIALARVAEIVPVVNPLVIKRQDLQRRQAIYAGTQGRPSGDVGADVQKIVKETQLPAGYRFDVGGQTKDQQEAFAGIVVALANHGRQAGLSVPDALLQAGLVRMRPIIMTTAAMIFGMLPLALALEEGGELQAPMGRAIIGGVITSTLLTLVVVPVIYSYLVRDKRRRAQASEEGAHAPPTGGG